MERPDTAEQEEAEERRPEVEYNLLPWMVQARIKLARRPYLVIEGGVHTGKTSFGAASCLEELYLYPGETTWWPAPEDWHIRRFWEEFRPAANYVGATTLQTPHCYARTPAGSTLHGVTMKNLRAIASYHPKRLWVDEVNKMTSEAWNLLRIRMLNAARVVLMSTRGGPLWEKLRKWGIDKRHGKWDFIQVTTADAGLILAEEEAMAKADLPLWLYLRDFKCEASEGEAKIFQGIDACAKGKPEAPIKGEKYVVTYDPADTGDYGFATVWRGYRVVFCERWQQTGYRWQAQKVVGLAVRYNMADIVFDQRGVGVPVGEMMEEEIEDVRHKLEAARDGEGGWISVPFVTGVQWDNTLKGQLTNTATTMIARRQIELVDRSRGEVYAVFVDEHKAFERRRSSSGLVYTYQHPPGEHDDSVSTTLLRMHGSGQPRITVIDGKEEKADGDSNDGAHRRTGLTILD